MLQYYFKIMEYCASNIHSRKMVLCRRDRKGVKQKLVAVQGSVLSTISQASEVVWR